jgi:hypothetical protein
MQNNCEKKKLSTYVTTNLKEEQEMFTEHGNRNTQGQHLQDSSLGVAQGRCSTTDEPVSMYKHVSASTC